MKPPKIAGDVDQLGFTTRCVHAGESPDPTTGAHGVPLYQNVTYGFRSYEQLESMRAGEIPHFTYSPRGNPTVRCLELKMADLESTEAALATNSGMAAISSTLLHLLAGGGHLVAPAEMYELAYNFLRDDMPTYGGSATFVDFTDVSAVAAAMTPATRAIYAEPFSNPSLRVADIPALAELAHRHGLPLVVDNTFLSPALLRPAGLGADLVIHSATKYLSGHGQVQGGFVCGRRELLDPIKEKMMRLGSVMSPFAAWVIMAGIKTLPLRVSRHSANAARLASLLADHPATTAINYPGLAAHPQHTIAANMVGPNDDRFGGMLSFTLRGGRAATAAFVNAIKVGIVAVSLGDCATLVWPWATRDLIRVSVGIEDTADLEADFLQALDRAMALAAD